MTDISPEALETWGRLAPKSALSWIRKLALVLGVLVLPWFLIPWRYSVLYILLAFYVGNETEDAIPAIVALTKQELTGPPK
jgi:hypothetical protein